MKLQETLEHLNFSRLEAQIYMALIGNCTPFYLQCAGAHAG